MTTTLITHTPKEAVRLGPLLESLRGTIEENSDLTVSPQIIDAKTVPQTNLDKRFSLDLQTKNSGKYRDRIAIRMEHQLRVSFLKRMNMNRQHDSYKEALDSEELVIKALMDRSENPELSVKYTQTRRNLLATREYLLVEITFAVSGDLPITS